MIRWRVFDIAVSLVGLIVFSPIILLCAIATVLDSGLPTFNGAWRLGKHGTPFRCWKIRTLKAGHEAILESHLAENEAARKEWQTYAKLIEDPRVTHISRSLRRTSLDELPQLWNVLSGDMACFGPRPFLARERHVLGLSAHHLLAVRPGLISAYTAHGRSRLTVEQRVKLYSKFARRMGRLGVKWDALTRTIWHCMRGTCAR